MSVRMEWTCDSCGKQSAGIFPAGWKARGGIGTRAQEHACSWECVDAIIKAERERPPQLPDLRHRGGKPWEGE